MPRRRGGGQEIVANTTKDYDAACNPVGRDLVVGPPNAFRWVDGPFNVNLIGGFRTSDGVAVQINGSYANVGKGRPEVPASLTGLRLWARDVNSGVLLWHRLLVPDTVRVPYAGTYTETFVAAGGRVYQWQGYGLTATPPVTAGGLGLVAHVHEHRLTATRAGQEIWNFVAGGRIGAPPVVNGDRAIFGCHDGHVYSINVKDGTLAWRFLAAPADRRHTMLGQVESAYPVFNVVPDGEK